MGFDGVEELKKGSRLRMPATKMYVTDKDRPYWSSGHSLALETQLIAPLRK